MSRLATITLLCGVLAVSACGGSGSGGSAATGGPTESGKLSPLTYPNGKHGKTPPRSNEVTAGSRQVPGKATGPKGAGDAGVSAPCRLVSRAQVRAAVGARMRAPHVAPQGPTCVFPYADGKRFITVAVQSLDTQALARQHSRTKVTISNRSGYCVNLGQPMLYIPLRQPAQALVVTAPCSVAKRLAAPAMHQLVP
jgi:hypothetical protein